MRTNSGSTKPTVEHIPGVPLQPVVHVKAAAAGSGDAGAENDEDHRAQDDQRG